MEITDLITNLGIPGAIAIYLVWWVTKSLNSKLDSLTSEITKLRESITQLRESIERSCKGS